MVRFMVAAAALFVVAYQVKADFQEAALETPFRIAYGRPEAYSPRMGKFTREVESESRGRPVLVVYGNDGIYRAALIQRVLYPRPVGAIPEGVEKGRGGIDEFVRKRHPACVVLCDAADPGIAGEVVASLPAGETGGLAKLVRLAPCGESGIDSTLYIMGIECGGG